MVRAVPHADARAGTQAGCSEVMNMTKQELKQLEEESFRLLKEKMAACEREGRHYREGCGEDRCVTGGDARGGVEAGQTDSFEYGRPSSRSREEARHIR